MITVDLSPIYRCWALCRECGEPWSGPIGRRPRRARRVPIPTDVPRLPPRSRARLKSRRVRCVVRAEYLPVPGSGVETLDLIGVL